MPPNGRDPKVSKNGYSPDIVLAPAVGRAIPAFTGRIAIDHRSRPSRRQTTGTHGPSNVAIVFGKEVVRISGTQILFSLSPLLTFSPPRVPASLVR